MKANQYLGAVSCLVVLTASAIGLGQAQKGLAPIKHKITPKAAQSIALKKRSGKLLKPAHLEREDGQWQYEVLIQSGKTLWEVNVNADSGKIASIEKTSASEEAKESKSEHKSKG